MELQQQQHHNQSQYSQHTYEHRVRYNELVSSVGVHPTNYDMYRLSKTRHYAIPTLALNRLLVRVLAQSRASLVGILQRLKESLHDTTSTLEYPLKVSNLAKYTSAVIQEITNLHQETPIRLNELELYNLYSCLANVTLDSDEDGTVQTCSYKNKNTAPAFYADSCTDIALNYRLPYVFDEKHDPESLHGPYLTLNPNVSLVTAVAGVRALPTASARFVMFKAVLYKCIQLDRQTASIDDRILSKFECILDDATESYDSDYVDAFLDNADAQQLDHGYCYGLMRAIGTNLPRGHRTERNVNYSSLLYFLSVDYNSALLKCKPKLTRSDCEYIFKRIVKGAPESMVIDRCAYTVNQIVKCFPDVGTYSVQVYNSQEDNKSLNFRVNKNTIHLLNEKRVFEDRTTATDEEARPDLVLNHGSTHGTVVTFGEHDTELDKISSDDYCALMEYAQTLVELTFRFGNFEVLQLALQLAPYNIKDATNVQLTMTRTKGDIDAALVLKGLWETIMGKSCDLSYLFNILCKKYKRTEFDEVSAANELVKFVLFDCNRINNLPVDVEQARYAYESIRGNTPDVTLYYATFFRLKELELVKLYHSTPPSERDDEFMTVLKALYVTSVHTSPLGKRLVCLLNFDEDMLRFDESLKTKLAGRLPFAIPHIEAAGALLVADADANTTTTTTKATDDQTALYVDFYRFTNVDKSSIESELEYRIYADYYIKTRDQLVAHLL
nr:hypothetical protein HvNV078 [Heliothis virescens nudivirus]